MSLNRTIRPVTILDGIEFRQHCSRFAVSKCGKVIGRLGRVLKPKANPHYLVVSYCDEGLVRHVYVHRLVASVWLGPMPSQYIVNHKDGVKFNNHVDNLEWCTAKENTQHAIREGLIRNLPTKGQQGFQPSYS